MALADMLDLDARGRADILRTLADTFAQWLGKARVVENSDAFGVQKTRHSTRIACPGQCAGDDDSVVTRQHAVQVRRVSISQCLRSHDRSPRYRYIRDRTTCLVPALPA
ncbi:hypothetical protein BSU04_14275 [Caballeronia sordidicola]|uniref:Uncharacterized protein n=1 Tax=Caballeronia sordidicola TaxID=196367 RepID=A0A226X3C4_CABSO|nr:hypothetical protein BSU04_14275 [Caballeronia sordidicola]